jgi:hypothetical protein
MNCTHCQSLLTDHDRNTLPAATRAEVDLHLQHCAVCAEALAALREVNRLLDVELQPSPQLRQTFLAGLRQYGGAPSAPGHSTGSAIARLFQAWWPSRPLGAFSYSAALLLCGVLSGQLLPQALPGSGAADIAADIPRERLIQLCAVPPQATNLL